MTKSWPKPPPRTFYYVGKPGMKDAVIILMECEPWATVAENSGGWRWAYSGYHPMWLRAPLIEGVHLFDTFEAAADAMRKSIAARRAYHQQQIDRLDSLVPTLKTEKAP